MSEIVNESLRKIIKGSTFVFMGTIISMFLAFVGKIILIRFTTQSEYGTYILAFTVANVFITISTVGLSEGSARYIAYFRGKKELKNVKSAISSSIRIALVTSILFTSISFFGSDFIAKNIFHPADFSTIIKIFSITIPFAVFINVFIAIYRGFDRVDIKIYINDILRTVLYIIFLLTAVLLGASFIGMIYAYALSIVITSLVLLIYFVKKYPFINDNTNLMVKKLLIFSFPLLAVSMLLTVMGWTDTLMLGYFKTPGDVGIYNAAQSIANLLSVVISSVGYLYTPIASQLYGKNQIKELGRSYAISTKWSFMATLPLFFIFFSFPEVLLNLLFGSRYICADIALRILALGFIFNSFFGLNYYTLIITGKSNFIMLSTLIGATMNILLNMILIPLFGIAGAAIASAISFLSIEILMTIKLYTDFRIHTFSRNYLRLSILSISLIFIFYFVRNFFITVTIWVLLVIFSLFILTYILSILFLRILEEEDVMIIAAIEKRLGTNLSSIRMFLKMHDI